MLENQGIREISGNTGNKADTFTAELLNRILRTPEGVNLPVLNTLFGSQKTGNKDYMRLYRLLNRLVSRNLINFEKIDGFRWYFPRPEAITYILERRKTFTTEKVDLTSGISKTIQSVNLHDKTEHQGVLEQRALNLRFLRRSKYWKDSQFLMNYKELTAFGWKRLNDNFDSYKGDVEGKWLVFKKIGADVYKKIPYTHRFMEKGIKEKIREYNHIWESANRYKTAVHLTLTYPPDLTLREISAGMCNKFNKLVLWIKRVTKQKDLGFLKVLEFTDRGVFHLHIIIFGVGRICDKKSVLTPKLVSLGYGKINYIYSMINRNGRWLWKKARPREVEHNNPQSHFRKYLEKSLSEDSPKTAQYWLSGKRFFSCSYGLLDSCSKEIVEGKGGVLWEYVGIFSVFEIPDFIFDGLGFCKGGEIT